MSKDSKKPGGDLLSELFETDAPKSTPSSDVFSKPTHIADGVSESTEANKLNQSLIEEFGDKTEFAEKDSADPSDKTSLDSFLGGDSIPGVSMPPKPKAPEVEMGDNLFDGILDEEPLADEKINFFSAEEPEYEKTAMISHEQPNPFENEGQESKVIMLGEDKPIQDPIDEALEGFVEGTNVDAPVEAAKVSSPASHREIKTEVKESFAAEDTQAPSSEMASADFAEIFSNGPIQVSEAAVQSKKIITPKLKRSLGLVAGLFVTAGILAAIFMKLKTDSGILGYHLEGWSLLKSYHAPTEEERKDFVKTFADTQMARTLDDPKKIENSMSSLESILVKDERNLEAIGSLLEQSAILILWNGVSSQWSQKFDENFQRLENIFQKTQKRVSLESVDRAMAWRLMAIGDYAKASQEFEAKLKNYPTPEDESYGVLAELAFRRGDLKETDKWMQKISRKTSPRVRLIQILQSTDKDADLAKLSDEGYLPAKVALFTRKEIKKDSVESQIVESEKILEDVKSYPVLVGQIREYRGDLFSFKSQNAQAREEWKTIVEKDPKNARLWMKLANSFEEDALWDEAVDAYKAAQKAGANDESLVVRLAHLLHIRGRIVDSIALLDQALATQPKSARLLTQKGRVQLSIYQDDSAKTSFEKALSFKADADEAILGLADIAIRSKDLNAAEVQFKKVSEKSPRYADALKGLAGLAEMKHDLNRAKNFYLQALKVDPKLETVYPQLVKIYLVDEKDEDAENLVRKGLEVLPRSPHLKVALSRIHQFQGESEQALKDLEPIRKSYGHLPEVSFALADHLIARKEYAEAWKVLNPLISKELRDPELLYLRAKAFYENPESAQSVGSNEAAYRLVESASHREPENIRYRVLAARLALKMQDKAMAFEHIDSVLKHNSAVSDAYLVRGDIQMDNGEYTKATNSYQEAMKYTRFRSPIYHRLAESFKAIGKNSLAIQYYKKVTQEKNRSQDAEPYLELGKLYNEEGHFQSAMVALRKAIDLNPKISESYYFLGFIQKELGDKKGALQSFEKFLGLEPSSTESATIRDEIYFLKNNSRGN
ncbi:MAG: tetratricopeptide repeat protein [Deltaproteobacteria bacterium]|nr:tetratricopeptide repeat protein [Deltaproteobacteria bacterium]